MRKKQVMSLFAVLVLLVPAVLISFYYTDIFEKDEKRETKKAELGDVLNSEVVTRDLSSTAFSIKDLGANETKILVPCLTPLVVRHHALEKEKAGSGVEYNPLILGTSKTAERHRKLTSRELIEIENVSSVEVFSAQMLSLGWESSELVIVVASYQDSVKISPLASYLTVPVLFIKDEADASMVKALRNIGCKRVLSVGNTKPISGFKNLLLERDVIDRFFLQILKEKGESSKYLVVTNPEDIWKYERKENTLPITDLSLVSSELGAYRKAPILFVSGLDYFNKKYGDGYTQLGVGLQDNNVKAEKTRELVVNYAVLYQSLGMKLEYLALVGGPVTLPFYYENITAYTEERQYTPSDYYFGNTDKDPYQEIAVGRIVARDVSDASSLLVSTLAFAEVIKYPYPKDTSSAVYDTVSEDWKENSLMAIGTTKIGPAPGILTPTLVNQSRTMAEGGFHVTTLGYDAADANVVKEIIDEMNYAVYYGHGNYDCWYSSVANPIDADTISAQNLKPGFAIAMACLTGMIDNATIPLQEMLSLAFIYSGFTGYIGANRVAYGLYAPDEKEEVYARGTGALYLADVFSKKVCKEDMDIGKALMSAKNALITAQGWDKSTDSGFEAQITVWEYVLYGDPAGNLYVPKFDG